MAVQVVVSTNTVVQAMAANCTPWYLFGGVSASDCLIAYTPIGASSYNDSLDNNAAPGNGQADGTYDAETGSAPSWDITKGWSFTAASNHYLSIKTWKPTITTISLLVRFNNISGSDGVIVGFIDATSTSFYIKANTTLADHAYSNAATASVAGGLSGDTVMGFANRSCYKNGILDATLAAAGSYHDSDVHIGRDGHAGGSYLTGDIAALAIYGVELTQAQVAAITVAMNALPDYADD